MQSLKQIKNRIRSVENTKKVTGAMQMISVSKLNRIQDSLFVLRPYASKLENFMQNLARSCREDLSAYFQESSREAGSVLVLVTSDSGLCGMYNQNVLRAAEEFLKKNKDRDPALILVGQKGLNYFKSSSRRILSSYAGLNGKFKQEFCDRLTGEITDLFLSGRAGEIHLAYTYFENSLFQKPLIERFLPVRQRLVKPVDYIVEPDLKSILAEIIPRYLRVKMQLILMESFTSEHAARIVSMKTATDNAKDLLVRLVLFRNKMRQAGITQDILEISSSAEALRG
ncbi:MAG: ATP synthase F1 subunit gamma [Candidatus Omnitrophica bacterium]|nr:ATP synthase F1 subunit gamma [Candidatus Omnitrophota bacterium]